VYARQREEIREIDALPRCYSAGVDRLSNIVKRNRRGMPSERTVVSLGIGLLVLLILGLAVFTDLGRPKQDTPARNGPPPPSSHDKKHVDGVYLGH